MKNFIIILLVLIFCSGWSSAFRNENAELGIEIVEYPDFSSDFFDLVHSLWTYDAINDEYDASGSTSFGVLQETASETIVHGDYYQVIFTITNYVQGEVQVYVGAAHCDNKLANGTYTEIIKADTFGGVINVYNVKGSSYFQGTLTDLSIKRIH